MNSGSFQKKRWIFPGTKKGFTGWQEGHINAWSPPHSPFILHVFGGLVGETQPTLQSFLLRGKTETTGPALSRLLCQTVFSQVETLNCAAGPAGHYEPEYNLDFLSISMADYKAAPHSSEANTCKSAKLHPFRFSEMPIKKTKPLRSQDFEEA